MCKLKVTNIDGSPSHYRIIDREKPCDPCRELCSTKGFSIFFRNYDGLPCCITEDLQHCVQGPRLLAEKTIVPGRLSVESPLPQRWYFSLCFPSVPFFPVLPLRRRAPYLA